MAPEEIGGSVISRRRLIKAGAVVGGTIWAAPVIESFTSRAAAGSVHFCCTCTGDPTGNQCTQDAHPTTPAACDAFCAGLNAGGTTFTTYTWCPASPTSYSCNAPTAPNVCSQNGIVSAGCTTAPVT